ncbi:MAG TPA: 1-acyl-sn-glycerol-3-phosphate acyltransferase [Aeromonadales bacterium]|nr:1-acyl-sn-glycerol-3-phosphate acyltransferase [Aeromonadales bacterium]
MTQNLLTLIIILVVLVLIFSMGIIYHRVNWGSRFINWFEGWNRFYCHFVHGLDITPFKLPEGPVLLICNHMSALDPLLISAASPRPLRFLVAKEEYERPYFKWLLKPAGCIPVDRDGRVEKAFREAIRRLKNNEAVALFPHGGMQLDTEPHKPLKQGVFKLAELVNCPIACFRLTGVRAPGSTFRSLLFPARAKLEFLQLIPAGTKVDKEMRQKIGLKLLGK